MLQNKTIAVFMDVDNCALSFDNYKNALEQIASMGKIASCKLYGVSDRRHREIISDANDNGYDVALAMRIKKRNSRVFDNRILVDVVEKVVSNKQVDAVAVVCAPADMVYLYRFLKKREVAVIALDNADEDSVKLVDEVLDLGQVQVLKFPSQKPSKTVDDILEEGVDHAVTVEEKNAKLQDEIARLRQENGIVLPQQGHVEEAVEQLEQSQVEDTCQQEQSLVEDIAQLSGQDLPQEEGDNQPAAEEVHEEAGVEECQEQPQQQPQEDALPQTEKLSQDQSAQQVADDEDQLISQIESLRANLSDDSNDEELIAQIKSLLDGLE